ncbi:putative zinc finger protein [Lentzea atacamensis]|uniref:Zinc finger protein n=2 Tax=Lentzea TaxID=165301 RepID=A0A316I6G0_9PSEU|nr:zf-HC2 domain-containing protein [Lentzea atacamensis]PWK88098.1 putative zinc finger protein [Lentzea atacamensis]RAS71182.1 putative zinc finger protein [Lentzea atacamensis]
MTAGAHDAVTLGCYALGVLDAHESLGVEQHLRGCPSCRAQVADFHRIRKVLDEVPREAFLHELEADLPKPSDLVLQRALRQIRNESAVPQQRVAESRPRASPRPVEELPEPQHAKPRRWPGYLAAAAVAAVVAFGGGAVFMQNQSPGSSTAASYTGEATAAGGIRLVAEMTQSSQDRYLVKAEINGLPAAQRCKLIVVGTDGTKTEAHVWTSSEKGRVEGAKVSGLVSVPPDQVKSVVVENAEGKTFVAANLQK